ncbi:MAG: neutral zinc metallopeptidase [Rhodothermales bacterium]
MRSKRWNILEEGDPEEGLSAAAAVGDDRLQRMAGQRVQPESFTHGSSEQRQQWFTTGLRTGSAEAATRLDKSENGNRRSEIAH